MKRKLAMLAAILLPFVAMSASYTNSFVRNGVTYVQRGGLTIKDYVVTNVTSSGSGGITTNDVCNIITNTISDYANVSNAAMNALSRAEAEAGFTEWNATPPLPPGMQIMPYTGIGGGWAFSSDGETFSSNAKGDANSTSLTWTSGDDWGGDYDVTATRTRLPTMADLSGVAMGATNYTDETTIAAISTNNPAFVAAVTNCPVVIAAADGTTIGDFGEYGTLGALLAALAAAITWLKTNKADASSLPYALSAAEVLSETTTDEPNDTITYGLADRTINDISIQSGKKYVTIVMPAVSVAGHARDLVVRLAVSAADLNITWGTAVAGGGEVDYETEDGEFPDLSASGMYLVRLTETAAYVAGTGGAADVPAKFLIQCQPLQTAAAGGAA